MSTEENTKKEQLIESIKKIREEKKEQRAQAIAEKDWHKQLPHQDQD